MSGPPPPLAAPPCNNFSKTYNFTPRLDPALPYIIHWTYIYSIQAGPPSPRLLVRIFQNLYKPQDREFSWSLHSFLEKLQKLHVPGPALPLYNLKDLPIILNRPRPAPAPKQNVRMRVYRKNPSSRELTYCKIFVEYLSTNLSFIESLFYVIHVTSPQFTIDEIFIDVIQSFI